MKISLLEVKSKKQGYINKDVMGGYGEAMHIGESFWAKRIEKRKKCGINLPIFDFAYLAAILNKNGHEVSFKINEVEEADLVIIHSSIVDYKAELEFAKRIKTDTKSKVGFIGPFASVMPELFLEVADFVIVGEPEYIAEKISNDYIPQGKVNSAPLKDLDQLPHPLWEKFPINEYSYAPVINKKPFLPILSSRGCTFSCNYCPYLAYYGKLRQRGVGNIIDEIEMLKKKFNVKGLLFRDPLFTANKKRVLSLADELIKKELNIEWACETHFDFLDKELIDRLYKSGLKSINVGIEAYDQEILKKATRKSSEKEHQERIIKYCNEVGVNISAFYMLGLPEDNKESILKTIDYAKKLNTPIAQFFIFTPFPGTKFFEEVKDKLLSTNWENFDSFTPVYKHNNLTSEELLKLKEKAFIDYYYRPTWVMKHWRKIFNA